MLLHMHRGTPYIYEGEELGMTNAHFTTLEQYRDLGHDLMAGFRTLVGGEVTDYADMLTEARQIATGRMVKDAEALGADAIVGMRYASASVMQGAAEVIAYGTAVKFV